MVVFLVGKDTLKISETYINAFPAFSCPLFASKNPIVNYCKIRENAACLQSSEKNRALVIFKSPGSLKVLQQGRPHLYRIVLL